jgi:peptidoglycan hydrolase-like protein with peptidoglycan-binding domain
MVAVVFLGIGHSLSGGGGTPSAADAVPTGYARIVRTDIVERQQIGGTLGYRGSFTVSAAASGGVIGWLPDGGSTIRRGAPLYVLDGQPVRLLYGNRPAYRAFELGMSNGEDIAELQRNLIALGYGVRVALAPSGHFDLSTLAAIEAWQQARGLEPTGTLPLGSVVFLPSAIRVRSAAVASGASVQGGAIILSATATQPAVLVSLDPGSVAQLKTGDRVVVTMPDSTATPGRISSISRVATAPTSDTGQGPSTATIPVTIGLLDLHARGSLDQAPVQVAITTQEDRGVLAVPISALLARPDGGYAIRVAAPHGRRVVAVGTGLFDDIAGRVEINGSGLAPGMRVEVPAA